MMTHSSRRHARVTAVTAFAAIAMLAGTFVAQAQQSPQALRLARGAVVVDQPRGDGVVLGSVTAGALVEVIERRGNWIRVRPSPPDGAAWKDGWIHATSLEPRLQAAAAANRPLPRPGERMVRGFAHAAGTVFSAGDSFDTVLGSPLGFLGGGGAQFVFANGAFLQGSVERFRRTGSRVFVSGEQIFRLADRHAVTLTPIQLTLGYRATGAARITPYLGAGAGWHSFREEGAAALGEADAQRHHVSYHVVGGGEFALSRWLAIAGEVQWTAVPDAIGDAGVSALFEERDLGGTTFRFKLLIGR